MGITHVIRGEDLIDSTHRVLALRAALGATDAPQLRAPAADRRRRPGQAVEAPRRGRARGLRRPRLPARSARATTSRCSGGRPPTTATRCWRDELVGAVRPRPRDARRRGVRPRQARLAQRRVDPSPRRSTTSSAGCDPLAQARFGDDVDRRRGRRRRWRSRRSARSRSCRSSTRWRSCSSPTTTSRSQPSRGTSWSRHRTRRRGARRGDRARGDVRVDASRRSTLQPVIEALGIKLRKVDAGGLRRRRGNRTAGLPAVRLDASCSAGSGRSPDSRSARDRLGVSRGTGPLT